MVTLYEAVQEPISQDMIAAGQTYLGTCGALEHPSLFLNRAVAEHMLETTLERSKEPYGRIGEDMQDRAIAYFSRYFDPEDPMSMTYAYFVEGLLRYALLGVDINSVEGDDSRELRSVANAD